MKKVIVLFALVIVPFLFSCSNDDSEQECCPTVLSYTENDLAGSPIYTMELVECDGDVIITTQQLSSPPVVGQSYCGPIN
jgi:hypothetical protein